MARSEWPPTSTLGDRLVVEVLRVLGLGEENRLFGTFSLTPLAPDKTLLRTSWIVHEDAVEGVDYDIANLTAVWRATNNQDGYLSALNHKGISTDGYRQGPYAPEEKLVEHFKDYYVARSLAALEKAEA